MAATAAPGEQFRHLALFYHGPGEYLAVLRRFLQVSRERDNAVFIAVPGFKARLVRGELAEDSARATLVDMAELGRNPARIIPAVMAYARQHRGQPVSFLGEPVWPGRTAAERREATRHEALINLAFRDSLVTNICLYDGTGLPEAAVADAASTHPAVIKDGTQTASARYLEPPGLPPRCRRALPRPTAQAEVLAYRDNLSQVRRFVARRAGDAGLAPLRVADLVLAASELAGNTVYHTNGGGTVQVWRTRNEIVCQVADTGQITDPLAWHRPPSAEQLGGKGLWLVNQLCDLVQARTGRAGTTTRMHMRLSHA